MPDGCAQRHLGPVTIGRHAQEAPLHGRRRCECHTGEQRATVRRRRAPLARRRLAHEHRHRHAKQRARVDVARIKGTHFGKVCAGWQRGTVDANGERARRVRECQVSGCAARNKYIQRERERKSRKKCKTMRNEQQTDIEKWREKEQRARERATAQRARVQRAEREKKSKK